MKKNYCLWILLSCNVFLAQAQLVKVERSYKINKETPGFYPVFSNDGKELLYTSENYKGLFLYDLKSKTSDVITEVDGAGYNPAFDRNGEQVYYRATEKVNMRQQNTWMCYQRKEEKSKTDENYRCIIFTDIRFGVSGCKGAGFLWD